MSLDDRLSFGDSPLGGAPPEIEPEEESEEKKKPNRAFIIIAAGMGGLILLGIFALVGALAFWLPRQKQGQVASVTQMAFIARGLQLDISFLFLAVVVPLVSLLTLMPVSVNGMGLREVGMVLLLAPIGITPAQAVTLSLLQFTTLLVASLVGALPYPTVAGGGPRMKTTPAPDLALAPRPSGESNYDPAFRRYPHQGREGQSSAAA